MFPKKKEFEQIKAKVKFRGLRMWSDKEILKFCSSSYPYLELEKVIGFSLTDKGKEIFIIEGRRGSLVLSDAG